MHHVAIMKKNWKLIPKILSGEKTIESRWYKNRIAPWNKVKKHDTIFFKNSGEPIIAAATVSEVLQFENLNQPQFQKIMRKYADKICLNTREYNEYFKSKNYAILIFLKDPRKIDKPIHIDKKGYGISSVSYTHLTLPTKRIV